MPENQKCVRCARKLSWIGLWDSFFLMLFKGAVGILARSHALTASALYSLHDVISSVAIIIGLRVATKPADKDHPYGHGNAEYIVSAFTSILIMGAVVFLMVDCVKTVLRADYGSPHWVALVAAILSVVANEVVYRYNICSARKLNSPALLAHAKHHRADAVASCAVVVAIAGARFGFTFLDPLVAVFEAGHLIFLSVEMLYHGGSGLIDCAIQESEISVIKQLLSDMSDVKQVRDIKTRQIGRSVWIDLYVALPGDKTIAEVSAISGRIRKKIGNSIASLGNLNVICV